MTSDMMSCGDLKASRGNLNSQLSRVSARSFAQSLSRLSNRGDQSTLSIALAVNIRFFSKEKSINRDASGGRPKRNLKAHESRRHLLWRLHPQSEGVQAGRRKHELVPRICDVNSKIGFGSGCFEFEPEWYYYYYSPS